MRHVDVVEVILFECDIVDEHPFRQVGEVEPRIGESQQFAIRLLLVESDILVVVPVPTAHVARVSE